MALTEKREVRLVDIREGGQFEIQELVSLMDGDEVIDTTLHRCVKDSSDLSMLPTWMQEIGAGLTEIKKPTGTGKRYDKVMSKVRMVAATREMAITEKTRIWDGDEIIKESTHRTKRVEFDGDHSALDKRTKDIIKKVQITDVVNAHVKKKELQALQDEIEAKQDRTEEDDAAIAAAAKALKTAETKAKNKLAAEATR